MPLYMWVFLKLMENLNFWAKSRPNLDQFAQKGPDLDQSQEIQTKVEALQLYKGMNLQKRARLSSKCPN